MSSHMRGAMIAGLATLLWTNAARAQDVVMPPVEPPPVGNAVPLSNPMVLFGPQQAVATSFGFERIGESWYFQLDPYLQLTIGKLTLGVQVPLDLLSPFPTPNPVDKKSAYGGVVRAEDFPSMKGENALHNYGYYLAMIRNLQWGQPTDPLYFQYGQFYGHTMGHGTIMDQYDNALDPTNSKPGLAFGINSKDYGGGEVFTNDIAWPATEIIGARLYLRPLGLAQMGPWAKKWAIGATFVTDRSAPLDAPGGVSSSELPASVTIPTRTAQVWGIDTEYQAIDLPILALTPYIDLNNEQTLASSWGLHIGVLGRFAVPIANALRIWARLEYRTMQPGYIPDYYDSLYDAQRSAYPVSPTLLVDKANAAYFLAPHGEQGTKLLVHGLFGEATVDVLHIVQAGGQFRATPGVPESGNLMLFATLPHLGPVKVSAYYLHNNFEMSDAFKIDSQTSLSGVIMYDVFGPLWLMAVVTRGYVADDHPDGTVTYTPETSEMFGIETYFPF